MIKFHKKKLSRISKTKIVELHNNFTLSGENSGMKIQLRIHLKNREHGKKDNRYVIIATKNNKIVGWSLINKESTHYLWTKDITTNCNSIMLYVDPGFRENGLGSLLMNKSLNFLKKRNKITEVLYFPWDKVSTTFFKKISKNPEYKNIKLVREYFYNNLFSS